MSNPQLFTGAAIAERLEPIAQALELAEKLRTDESALLRVRAGVLMHKAVQALRETIKEAQQ